MLANILFEYFYRIRKKISQSKNKRFNISIYLSITTVPISTKTYLSEGNSLFYIKDHILFQGEIMTKNLKYIDEIKFFFSITTGQIWNELGTNHP